MLQPRSKKQYKHIIYSVIVLLLAALLLPLEGCGGKDEAPEASIAASYVPAPTKTPAPTLPPAPTVAVTKSTAGYFPDIEGQSVLYVAMEYENTGTTTLIIENVSVVFNTGQYKVDGSFTPMLYKDDFLLPGRTATLAYWFPYSKEPDLAADAEIQAEITLTPTAYDLERSQKSLELSNLRLIDNYPGFSTLSGSIRNPQSSADYSLSLVYVSLYNDADELLAVWHFTQNMAIPADETRNFVTHMQTLPIPNLSADATKIVARGIGID